MQFVPVVDRAQRPLMPTTGRRAARWIASRKATPFWRRGIFCVRLNVAPSGTARQPIAVGIDPGSKREGWSVVSAAHTYVNLQAHAVTWAKDAVETRRIMRRNRRQRKTPYRACRRNRARGGLPPSTKARWQWKLRIAWWLTSMFPVTRFVVEDVDAKARPGRRRWNASFSPMLAGKQWFYAQLAEVARVSTRHGWETKALRDEAGLVKTRDKLAVRWSAHCVDAWVLARCGVAGARPDNTSVLEIVPLRFHRRQLHRLQPAAGGARARYGGTRSLGFTRGSLVRHPKWGVTYVGGATTTRLSLHAVATGERLTKLAKPGDCRFLTYNSWRVIRADRGRVSAAA